MRINLTSVHVDDQEKAAAFYTEVLGFVKKQDFPVGQFKWLTVVSPEEPDGVELLLEPNDNPAVRSYQQTLFEQGIPHAAFAVDYIQQEYARLKGLGGRIRDGAGTGRTGHPSHVRRYVRQPDTALLGVSSGRGGRLVAATGRCRVSRSTRELHPQGQALLPLAQRRLHCASRSSYLAITRRAPSDNDSTNVRGISYENAKLVNRVSAP